MHNNIMAVGSRDRPPMLVTGRYAQWQSCFIRYVDTKPNGEALKKCILNGPYKFSNIIIPGQRATDKSLEVPERTTPETFSNLSPANKAHYEAEKESIHLILTGIGMTFTQPLMLARQLMICGTIDLDKESYHKLFDILKQYQKEGNEIRAEKIVRNANPLALIADAQPHQETYYQVLKPQKSYPPPTKQSSSTKLHASTRHKGKEIAKPITPPSELASEEDSDLEQAQRDKDMQKNLALIAKYFKKLYKPTNNNLRTSSNSKNRCGHYSQDSE
ncbi:hypothetical protein Tco_0971213 [Tanacetum coccineum]